MKIGGFRALLLNLDIARQVAYNCLLGFIVMLVKFVELATAAIDVINLLITPRIICVIYPHNFFYANISKKQPEPFRMRSNQRVVTISPVISVI